MRGLRRPEGDQYTEVKQALEMINQMLDQMSAAQVSQPAKGAQRTQKENGKDFDELIQQKRQEPAKSQDGKDQTVQKKDTPKESASDAPQNGKAPGEEEVPEDAAAVLAAMMFQPQQEVVQTAEVQTGETAAPAAVESAELLVDTAPVQGETGQTAPETQTVEVQPQVEPQQETAAAQTAPQADTAPQQTQQVSEAPEQVQQETQAPVQETAPEADHASAQTERAPVQAEQNVQADQTEETPVEAPLFQPEMEATPVKVAEPVVNPENPVPIESDEAPRDIVDVMEQCLPQDGQESIAVIRVEPENLGPVTMHLTRDAEGVIHMVLEALNPKTAALLDKHAAEIQNIAADNTRQEVRVEIKSEQSQPFPENWKENQEQQQRQQQRQEQRQEERSEPMEDFVHRLRLGLTGAEGV